MKKRIFAFLLALCLILNMTSGIAFATEGAEDDGHTWPAEWTVVTEATCTAVGEQVKKCQDPECGIVLASEEIPMTAHTPEGEACKNDYVEPTCTEKGHDWLHCSVCKQLLHEVNGEFVVCTDGENCETCYIPALGHSFATIEAEDPTCTEVGHNEYRVCTRLIDEEGNICGAYEEGHEKVEIPANGHGEAIPAEDYVLNCDPNADDEHSFDNAVTAVCSICGEILEQKIVKPAPHTWEDKEGLAPTCIEGGYTEYKQCSICGRIEGKADIEPLGHSWKYYGALAGSCTEPGRHAGYACSVCGVVDPDRPGYEWIPAPGHVEDIILEAVAPTCTETGLTEGKQCSVCGEITEAQKIIEALGHSWKTILGVKATCTEDGEGAHSLCTVCGEKQYVDPEVAIIPAHGHSNEDGYYPENAETINAGTANTERKHDTDEYDDTWMTEEEAAKECEVTCLTDGYKGEELCVFCNEVVVESVTTPALGHDWVLTVPGVLPTCTETGISDEWDCSRCEAHHGGEIINARGHKMVSVEATLPTCDIEGNFAYDYCSVCGFATNEEYLDENGIVEMIEPKLVGTEMNEVVATLGETEVKLEKVDGEWVIAPEFVVAAYNHRYVEDVVALAPTCTESGIEEGATRCVICGEYFDLYLIPALDHPMSDIHVVAGQEPDCYNGGWLSYVWCDACDKAVAVEGSASAIKEIKEQLSVSEITMPADGSHPVEFLLAALGHDAQPGVALEPTCHEAGHTAGLYCDRCKLTIEEFEIIPALGCEMVEIEAEIPAGCTTTGKTAVFGCIRCDCTEGGEKIPATNHDAGEVTPIIPATCTEYGFGEGAHCTKCEVNYEPVYEYLTGTGYISAEDLFEAGWLKVPELIDPLGHDMSDPVTAEPTCTEQGYDNYSECQREGCEYFEGAIIPALDHVWCDVPGGEQVAPTCTMAGTDGIHQCLRCRVTEAVVLPALGHDWVHVDAVEATCAAPGNIEYDYCARCDLYLVEGVEYAEYDVVVEDDGKHDNLMHVDAEMATCKDDGHSDGQYCDVCGYNNFTVIEANSDTYHAYLTENKDALLADGTLEWTITSEGDGTPGSGMQSVLCPCCGYIIDVKLYPEVLNGDVNMDGRVNSIDALMILQYKAGVIETLPNKVAADYNNDGTINSLDALSILNSKIN